MKKLYEIIKNAYKMIKRLYLPTFILYLLLFMLVTSALSIISDYKDGMYAVIGNLIIILILFFWN